MQKLEYWKKQIKGINFDDLPEFLKMLGFKSISTINTGSGNWQLVHRKKRVVIKHGYICSENPKKDMVPSIILPIQDKWRGNRFKIVIQPLCENKYIPEKKLEEFEDKYQKADV